VHDRQQCLERWPFRGGIEAADRAIHLAVAVEELGIIVDVLRHVDGVLSIRLR
jgi:hypothetical protein